MLPSFFLLFVLRCRFFAPLTAVFSLFGGTSYVFSFRIVFFYLVTTGWILTSVYVRIQSINQKKNLSLTINSSFDPELLLVYGVYVCCVLSSHLFWTSDLWTHHQSGSHRISPPFFFCSSACLNFYREKDSAVPFPRRP